MGAEIVGQEMLPAEFPAPVITADILIRRSLEEGVAQLEYFTTALSDRPGDEDEAAKERRILRGNMHCFAYLLDAVIADVLIEVQGYNRAWADTMADALEDKLEGGDYYPEVLWQWAIERGLDPEKIAAEAKTRIDQKDTK
ncbi:hypothetical protein [Arthrobacter phoenicis]|uniref:hypothetical protein n=2 Tax=Arthrobacter TaxID=1663 RepID=UPI0039A08336